MDDSEEVRIRNAMSIVARKPSFVWDARLDAIDELIGRGHSMRQAIIAVCGYSANGYIRAKYPDRFRRFSEASAENMTQAERYAKEAMKKSLKARANKRSEVLAAMRSDPDSLRAEAMLGLRAMGWKLEDVGAVFGLTRERVRQVIENAVSIKVVEESDEPAPVETP